MTWILVWAGLLIVVLYSPIGSPDLYYSENYYVENQSVTMNGSIANAPKGNYASDNSGADLDIPDVSSHLNTNYSVGSYQSTSGGFQGSSYSIQNQSYQNNNSSGSASFGSGGGSFIAGGGSHGSAGSSGVTMTNGITTMSLTSDLTNMSAKQGANAYLPNTGGTDPGGDPTGAPIPVGDGWGLLLFFGVCYAVFKKRSVLIGQLKNK